MKKIFICLAACFSCLMGNAQTTPTISVTDVYAQKGGTVSFTTNLTGGREGVYESFEFDIVLPEGFSTTGKGETNWEGASAPEVGSTRAGMMSSNYLQTSDQDNLMSVELAVAKEVEVGTYQVTLKNITLGYDKSKQDELSDVTFNVFVSDGIILDENSQVAPSAVSAQSNVTIRRPFKGGQWSTICLPINITAAKLQEAIGNYKLAEMTKVSTTKDGNDVKSIEVEFTNYEGRLVANHPYIIMVENDIEESFVVKEVRISETPADLSVKSSLEYDEENDLDYYPWVFTGTHVAKTVVPANSLFLSDGKFWYSKGLTKMKAFRAYFTFNDVLSSVADNASGVRFYVNDGDTQTEIQIPELMPMDGEYYDLKGQRVETPSKGIYIKDGKKVVVK